MKRTSEISKMVGISKRALQFYDDDDDDGLIKVERLENNYRLYDRRVLMSFTMLKMGMEIGFRYLIRETG